MLKIIMLLLLVCALFAPLNPVWGASDGAMKFRALNGLSEFTPTEAFLKGNFVADEIEPRFVFGQVNDFRKSRSCPTAWLIEDGQRDRIKNRENVSGPFEYTLYLEEDCPGKVVYYVFVDGTLAKAGQWMEWRKVFHRSKAEDQYGPTAVLLERAAGSGFTVDAELRFIEIEGALISKKPEDFLTGDLKFKPIYDLKSGKAAGK